MLTNLYVLAYPALHRNSHARRRCKMSPLPGGSFVINEQATFAPTPIIAGWEAPRWTRMAILPSATAFPAPTRFRRFVMPLGWQPIHPVACFKARRFFKPAEGPKPAPIGGATTAWLLLIRSMSARLGIRRHITRRAAREAGEPKSVHFNFLGVFTIWQSLTSRPRKL